MMLKGGYFMSISLIVEGIRDKEKLSSILNSDISIYCTYGTPSTATLEALFDELQYDDIYIFTDNDVSGKRIRGMLREYFPDATHLYTRREYGGVEKTPDDYILTQIEKAGLAEFVKTSSAKPAIWTKDQF